MGTLDGESIAWALMDIFEARSEGSESGLMWSPHIAVSGGHTALNLGHVTLWDDEDENSHPEHGWTVESELAHAEANIRDHLAALQALLVPAEDDDAE